MINFVVALLLYPKNC